MPFGCRRFRFLRGLPGGGRCCGRARCLRTGATAAHEAAASRTAVPGSSDPDGAGAAAAGAVVCCCAGAVRTAGAVRGAVVGPDSGAPGRADGTAARAAAAPAPASVDVPSCPPTSPTPTRRSSRSTRASAPRCVSSASGTSIRAVISSRWRRGEVAPVMSVRALLAMSADRERAVAPNTPACRVMVSSSSGEMPRSTAAALSFVAATTIRSRRRSSRSSTKRRGSWPVCTTRSIAAKADAGSATASASTTSSRSAASV